MSELVYERYDKEYTSMTCHVCRDLWKEIDRLHTRLDEAERKLAAWENQEPIAYKVLLPFSRRNIEKDCCIYTAEAPAVEDHRECGDIVVPLYTKPEDL